MKLLIWNRVLRLNRLKRYFFLTFFVDLRIPLDVECFCITYFIEPSDEEIMPPSMEVSNFRCMENITNWCSVNKDYSNCSKCLNSTLVNATTVKCIRCQKALVDIFITWTAPNTSLPILNYTIAYGAKSSVFGREIARGTILTLPPVSSVENI